MAHLSAHKDDCLLQELSSHEQDLGAWLNRAPENAILFVQDPVAALRAANLGISETLLQELEQTMVGIMRKLAAA